MSHMSAPMGEGEGDGGEKATAANNVDASSRRRSSRLPKTNDKISVSQTLKALCERIYRERRDKRKTQSEKGKT